MIQQTKQWRKKSFCTNFYQTIFYFIFSNSLFLLLFFSIQLFFTFPHSASHFEKKISNDDVDALLKKEFRKKAKQKNLNKKIFSSRRERRKKVENKSWFIGIAIGLLKLFFLYWLLYRIREVSLLSFYTSTVELVCAKMISAKKEAFDSKMKFKKSITKGREGLEKTSNLYCISVQWIVHLRVIIYLFMGFNCRRFCSYKVDWQSDLWHGCQGKVLEKGDKN